MFQKLDRTGRSNRELERSSVWSDCWVKYTIEVVRIDQNQSKLVKTGELTILENRRVKCMLFLSEKTYLEQFSLVYRPC